MATIKIGTVQGTGHRSTYADGKQIVEVEGIVTAIYRKATGERGFFIQDPVGDGDARTSDGILVFTGSAYAPVTVGDKVQVSGTVSEFVRSGTTGNLSVTQINSGATLSVLGNVGIDPATGLPVGITAVRIGDGSNAGERVIPKNSFGDDPIAGVFDPANHAIDFWEAVEGMAVTLENFGATGPVSSFGETWGVTHAATNESLTGRGGVGVREVLPFTGRPGSNGTYDLNSERVQLDRSLDNNKDGVLDATWSNHVGAGFGDVTGIAHYDRSAPEVLVAKQPTVTGNNLQRETTTLAEHGDYIRIASFNVENYNPADGTPLYEAGKPDKLDLLAEAMIKNLKLPEIIGLQEVQDNTGATDTGVVSATESLRELIQAIYNQSGVLYAAVDAEPVNNKDGGAPGGNIRPAYLFRADKVSVTDAGGALDKLNGLTLDPLGDDPTTSYVEQIYKLPTSARIGNNVAWFEPYTDVSGVAQGGTRKSVPVVFQSKLSGENILLVNNHFNSKGGSLPLFGTDQTNSPVTEDLNQSAYRREAQADSVREYINGKLATVPKAVVLGDVNDYQFFPTTKVLEGTFDLVNPQASVNQDVPGQLVPGVQTLFSTLDSLSANDRYSYVFEGNSQVLDQMLLSASAKDRAQFDVVHMNAEFSDQISDHDPSVLAVLSQRTQKVATEGADLIDAARFTQVFGTASNLDGADLLSALGGDDTVRAGSGNDEVNGGSGNDDLDGGSGDDTLIGGAGNDRLAGGTGVDTASYSGTLATATVTSGGASGVLAVAGADGTDTLSGVERISFADGAILLVDGVYAVDDLFYARMSPDVYAAKLDAEAHYQAYGWREGRDPNAYFSTQLYLAANKDVAAAGINPLTHYLTYGWLEGRDPSGNFSTKLYLQTNADVAKAGINPLEHFLAYGLAEGRKAPAVAVAKGMAEPVPGAVPEVLLAGIAQADYSEALV